MNKSSKFVVFLFVLQMLGNFLLVESRPEAKKGRGKSFGAGILAGGLAGAAVGHILTRPNSPTEVHHHHHIVNGNPAAPAVPNVPVNPAPAPAPRPSTIIERGETLPNGCFKQIVKEPDVHDITRFIETEQLICPPSVPVPLNPGPVHPAAVNPLPIHPAMSIVPVPAVVPVPVQPADPTDANHNPQTPVNPSDIPPNPQPIYTAPLVPMQPNPQTPEQPTNGAPTAPVIPPIPAIHPVHPAAPIAPSDPASSGSSHVIVLSKKTGVYEDKKNGGNRLMIINCGFLVIIIAFVGLF